jgi:membrane fusion protein, heavy metal efflux system
MKFTPKLIILTAAAALAVFVGYREISSMCGAPKVDAHGHGHGHGEEADTSHATEGFGTKVCEDGFFRATWETVFAADAPPAPQAKPAEGGHEDGHADGDKGEKGHKHADDEKEEKGHQHGEGEKGHAHGEEGEGGEGLVKLSAAQIKAAGIDTQPAASGTLNKEIAAPGRITLNASAQAKVVPKLTGTVATIEKQLGDTVSATDLLATIDSREMADAKADYLAASRAEELAKATFEREERLWKQKVTAEQEYLAARNAHAEAKIKLDVAHQRLHAIGLTDNEINRLPKIGDESSFRTYEIRAPISGQVTSRELILGETVGTDKAVFVIADPTKVWVEIAVAPDDLAFARQGQDVTVRSGTRQAQAKVIALSPVIDPETRSAKAIAELDNASGQWKPGDYVEARLTSGGQDVDILVPHGAVQTVSGNKVVFVSEAGGFRMRQVKIGREDSANLEVVSGLEFGETVATSNTFTLKAELGKAEAEHEH